MDKGTRLHGYKVIVVLAVVTSNLRVHGNTYLRYLFDGQRYKVTRFHFYVLL